MGNEQEILKQIQAWIGCFQKQTSKTKTKTKCENLKKGLNENLKKKLNENLSKELCENLSKELCENLSNELNAKIFTPPSSSSLNQMLYQAMSEINLKKMKKNLTKLASLQRIEKKIEIEKFLTNFNLLLKHSQSYWEDQSTIKPNQQEREREEEKQVCEATNITAGEKGENSSPKAAFEITASAPLNLTHAPPKSSTTSSTSFTHQSSPFIPKPKHRALEISFEKFGQDGGFTRENFKKSARNFTARIVSISTSEEIEAQLWEHFKTDEPTKKSYVAKRKEWYQDNTVGISENPDKFTFKKNGRDIIATTYAEGKITSNCPNIKSNIDIVQSLEAMRACGGVPKMTTCSDLKTLLSYKIYAKIMGIELTIDPTLLTKLEASDAIQFINKEMGLAKKTAENFEKLKIEDLLQKAAIQKTVLEKSNPMTSQQKMSAQNVQPLSSAVANNNSDSGPRLTISAKSPKPKQ